MSAMQANRTFIFLIYHFHSKETRSFWKKNKQKLQEAFPNDQFIYEDPNTEIYPINKQPITLVVIGEDSSFHYTINKYRDAWHQVIFGFIPVKPSKLKDRLLLPSSLSEQITILKKQNHIFINLLQCNHLDMKGINRQTMAYNDIYFNHLYHADRTIKNKPILSVFIKETQIYKGVYQWGTAFIPLANRQKKAPHSNEKTFYYTQVNKSSLFDLRKRYYGVKKNNRLQNQSKFCIQSDFIHLAETKANTLIYADSIVIGTFPLTLRLLFQPCRVISPLLLISSEQSIYKAKKVSIPAISK